MFDEIYKSLQEHFLDGEIRLTDFSGNIMGMEPMYIKAAISEFI